MSSLELMPPKSDIEMQFLQETKSPLFDYGDDNESLKDHSVSNRESSVNFGISSTESSMTQNNIQPNSNQNNGSTKITAQSCLGHPSWTLLSLLSAVICIIIPTSEYFLFVFVKTELCWLLFITIGTMEVLDASLPDASYNTYLWSYVISFFGPFLLFVINGWVGSNNNTSIKLNFIFYNIVVSTGLYFPFVIYGIDVYYNPISSSLSEDSTFSPSMLKASFIDAFTAANFNDDDDIIDSNAGIATEDSECRVNWLLWMKRKGNTSEQTPEDARSSENSHPSSESMSASAPHPSENSLISSITTAYCPPSHDSRLEQDKTRPHRVSRCYSFRSYCIPVLMCLPRKWFREVLGYNECFLLPGTDRRLQLLRSFMFILLVNSFWYFLLFFTRNYLTSLDLNNSNKSSEFFSIENLDPTLFLYFVVYIIVNTIIRIFLKRVGMAIDKNKVGTISLFFLGEVIGLMFYYTFYRLVFENVTSIVEFLELQFLHLGSEWLLYPVRATKMFHSFSLWIVENPSARIRFVSMIFPVFNTSGLSYYDWQQFIALDYGIRVMVVLLTGLGISLLLFEVSSYDNIRGDYNSSIVSSHIYTVILLILAAVILELINAAIINYVFFQRRNLAIYSKLKYCFKDIRFTVVATVFCTFLLINPFVASITKDNAKFVW